VYSTTHDFTNYTGVSTDRFSDNSTHSSTLANTDPHANYTHTDWVADDNTYTIANDITSRLCGIMVHM
jgi:hypothetical protein